ncbi:agmatinase family protein [Paenibacillus eucommiae]|uniref:Formiminoglutamase n=1 Tax=Paenibacillus eucommiae TaxID=1355755 RepID=A0ABS4J7E8_9BACL|nr:agmatinase family protein [Paenibacillus eucommiae]MBP1995176.1 formiminoglutamase [Paenibacillus eucommiae]
MSDVYDYINPPGLIYRGKSADRLDLKMNQLIAEYTADQRYEVCLLGVPLSRSSISASAASENPNAIRSVWQSFAAYNIDYDVDLSDLRIADMGDVKMHVTDIPKCHHNIEQAMLEVLEKNNSITPLSIGGDHSITCPLVKGLQRYHQGKKIGILQFDTHFDLRNLQDGGPSNGTPMRGLIESGTVKAQHIVNIGLHGYFNSLAYKQYADELELKYYTFRTVRKLGMEKVLSEALAYLDDKVDLIYLTVDIDVLDAAFAPAAPASTPGGMYSWELLEAVYQIGKHPKVAAMDIVCLDPHRDDRSLITVKTGAYLLLNFLCGFKHRPKHAY